MKVVILNGNMDPEKHEYEEFLRRLGDALREKGNDIFMPGLMDLKINHCTGCFTCWVKTPGICMFRDDMVDVLKHYVDADFVLFASPVVMGFVTSLLKKIIERRLPVILPYLTFVEDRFQHPHRYAKVPSSGLVVWKDENVDDDTLEIVDRIFRSNRIQPYLFTKLMDNNIEEIANEINGI